MHVAGVHGGHFCLFLLIRVQKRHRADLDVNAVMRHTDLMRKPTDAQKLHSLIEQLGTRAGISDPFSAYNALLRRIVSFAAACEARQERQKDAERGTSGHRHKRA
jgi:hypothetical protein